jgi:hypothetical protein
VAQWNNGKKEEFLQRKSFQVDKAIPTEELAASQVYKIPAARGHTALEALRTLPEKEKDILIQV